MRSQRCSQCGTRLDVSRMEEGAKFTCSNCSAVLVVGEVAVTKKSLSDSGPQFSPRKGKASEGAAPKGSAPKRPRRTRERAPAAEGGGKSKLPIFIGVGVVVVVGIAVAVLNMGGGPGGSSGPSPAEKWWTDAKTRLPEMDAAQIRSAIAAGKQAGYDQNPAFWNLKADELYKALLAKAPEDDDANRFYGRKALQSASGFEEHWAGLEKHAKAMPDEFLRFYEKFLPGVDGGKKVWMSEDEFGRAVALLESFAAWREKAEADPTPQLIEKGLLRAQPFVKGFGAVAAADLPVIVFLGSRELSDEAEKAVREAKAAAFQPRVARVNKHVAAVRKAWQEQVAGPLALPAFDADQSFYVFCFDARDAFTELARHEGRGMQLDVGSSLLFFYRTADPMAFGEIPSAPEADKFFTTDLGHVLVHMFQKAASRDTKDKWAKPMEEWSGLWLIEGLAEYVGGGVQEDGSFTGVSPRSRDFLRQADSAAVLLFSIRDIVRFTSYPAYERHMRDAYWPAVQADRNAPESVAAFIQAQAGHGGFDRPAFQSQCWYLCYFLNHFHDGKHKEAFRKLVKMMLQGRRNPDTGEAYGSAEDAFAAALGLKSQADWDKLQRDYDDFLPRAVGSG